MNDTRNEAHSADRLKVMAAFAVLYLVWGSTYLFIRIGVEHIPPAVLAGLRFLFAGTGLAIAGFARGGRWPSRRDWVTLIVLGVGLVVVGNGVVTWSEQWVPSGEAAFIVSSSALFIALFGTLGSRGERLLPLTIAGLVLGFSGTALMLLPRVHGQHGPLFPALALVGSTCCWAAAAMFSRSRGFSASPLVFSGLEMLVGGSILTIIALSTGQYSDIHWTWPATGALIYLTVFGSGLAYGTYNWLIHHAKPAKLGTTAYVNPAVALLLGWLVLGEGLSPIALAGVAVMFIGVVLVNLRRRRRAPRLLTKTGTGA